MSVSAQVGFGTKTDVSAVEVAQLSDTLDNTSSLFYWQERLWTLNDHGDIVFYAIDSVTGAIEDIINTELPIEDMEEVAQDENYFYFGDFGNNHAQLRREMYIYRMSKANLLSGNYVVDTTTFLFFGYDPDAENDHDYLPITDFDCEAMVASGDSLYLFTKQWTSLQTVCYALPKQPGNYTAEACRRFNIEGLVTGAWLHPDACLLVLCGYNIMCQPFVCMFYDYPGHDFFSGERVRVALGNGLGTQAEAITSKDGLHYYLTHEKFHRMGVEKLPHLLSLDLSNYLRDYLYPDTGSVVQINEAEEELTGLMAYPNPTSDLLTVDMHYYAQVLQNAYVVMYDARGREVLRRPVSSSRMQLSIKDFSPGEYLVGILLPEGLAEAVVIVKK